MKQKMIIGSIAIIAGLSGIFIWIASSSPSDTKAYEALLDTIYGTTDDRHYGEKLLHHRIQNVIKTCMEGKGMGYHPPAYAGNSAGVVSPGDLDVATPLGNTFGIADRQRAYAEGVEADHNSGGNKPGIEAERSQETLMAYSAAGDECMSKAMPLEEDYHPAGQQEVVEQLLNELHKVQTSDAAQPLLADYRDCLHKADYAVDSRFELYQKVLEQFPPTGQPWSSLATTKQWQEAEAAEQKAATADKTCREKLYHWATSQLRPTVERFNADPKVDDLRRGWAQIAADYKAAGL